MQTRVNWAADVQKVDAPKRPRVSCDSLKGSPSNWKWSWGCPPLPSFNLEHLDKEGRSHRELSNAFCGFWVLLDSDPKLSKLRNFQSCQSKHLWVEKGNKNANSFFVVTKTGYVCIFGGVNKSFLLASCIGYFSIAVIKDYDQGNLWKKAYLFRFMVPQG